MKLYIEKDRMKDNPSGFLRSQGYGFLQARGDGQDSFARCLYSGAFPRLHMYVNDRGSKWEFHLHLDQKQVSYKGSTAHSGEYEGEVVADEIERLRQVLGGGENFATKVINKKIITKEVKTLKKGMSAEERLGQGRLDDIHHEKEKKSFWGKLFT